MQEILQGIGKVFLTISVAIASLFGFGGTTPVLDENVGATIPIPVAVFQTSLQSSLTSSATSMTLVTGTDKSGDALSGYICFNIDEGTTTEEFVCGTVAGTAVTSMIRGLDPVDGDLEVTALKKVHRRGASVKVTNYPSLGILSRILNGDETLPNKLSYATAQTFTDSKQLISKAYADALAIAGCGLADTSSAGCVEIATQAEVDAGTATGGSGANIIGTPATNRGRAYNDYASDSVGTDAYAITISPVITAYATGQVFTFKAGTANTGAATLNVSALGAKTIKKNVSTDIATGDILANQIVTVVYDGTNMQLVSEVAGVITTQSQPIPTTQVFTGAATTYGSTTSRFDITEPVTDTMRYTWDGTGTDPTISSGTFPIGSHILIETNTMTDPNNGEFITTGVGSNYFEVTNASGVAENDKVLGSGLYTGSLRKLTAQTYTTPSGVKYVKVRTQGGGGAGGLAVVDPSIGSGGGGGGYAEEIISLATLGASQTLYVGVGGTGLAKNTSNVSGQGGSSYFGSLVYATGGTGGYQFGTENISATQTGLGGTGVGGDFNSTGGDGMIGQAPSVTASLGGHGGSSVLGGGGAGSSMTSSYGAGADGNIYGGGGGGAAVTSAGSGYGGLGAIGIIIVTEFY